MERTLHDLVFIVLQYGNTNKETGTGANHYAFSKAYRTRDDALREMHERANTWAKVNENNIEHKFVYKNKIILIYKNRTYDVFEILEKGGY